MGKIGQRGFTLLEVLVAMGILMMIVLMMSTLFHSSTIAWDNGLRQAEMSIQARAAMSLMQQDLAQAVCSDEFGTTLTCNIGNDPTLMEFCTLGVTTGDVRTIKSVMYEFKNGSLNRMTDKLVPTSDGQYGVYGQGPSGEFLNGVAAFEIQTADGMGYTTNLPQWVEIEMTLEATSAGAAGIRVWSNGRDKTFDTADDKEERLRTWRD